MDERRESRQELVDAPVRAVPAPADPGDGAGAPSEQTTDPAAAPARPDGGLPPGLAKKDELPPGLAKKEAGAPSGQAKQGGAPSGQQKAASPPGQEKKEDGDTGGPGSPGNSHGNGKAKGR